MDPYDRGGFLSSEIPNFGKLGNLFQDTEEFSHASVKFFRRKTIRKGKFVNFTYFE